MCFLLNGGTGGSHRGSVMGSNREQGMDTLSLESSSSGIFGLPQGTIPLGKLANLFRMGVTWNAFIIQPHHKLLRGGSEILSGNVPRRSLPSLFWGRVSCNWVFLSPQNSRWPWVCDSHVPSSQVYYQARYTLCRGLNQGLKHATSWVYLWSHCRRSLLSPCLCLISSLCSTGGAIQRSCLPLISLPTTIVLKKYISARYGLQLKNTIKCTLAKVMLNSPRAF